MGLLPVPVSCRIPNEEPSHYFFDFFAAPHPNDAAQTVAVMHSHYYPDSRLRFNVRKDFQVSIADRPAMLLSLEESHYLDQMNEVEEVVRATFGPIVPGCHRVIVRFRRKRVVFDQMVDLTRADGGVPPLTGEYPPLGEFAVATLFKDDWPEVDRFVRYYRRQGATAFLLYYNGDVTTVYENLPKGLDIFYGSWPFQYWLPDVPAPYSPHHAQPAFVNMVLRRFGCTQLHMLLCDLDEFVCTKNGEPLADHIARLPQDKAFSVKNHWGRIVSEDRTSIEFDIAPEGLPFRERTKSCYPFGYSGLIGVHRSQRDYTVDTTDPALMMVHFTSTSRGHRTGEFCGKGCSQCKHTSGFSIAADMSVRLRLPLSASDTSRD